MTHGPFPRIPIGELVTRGEAELKTGPFGTQLHAHEYTREGTPVINVRNIGFGVLKEDKLEFVSPTTAARLSSHLLYEGDIVFGRKGAVERHVFVRSPQHGWMQGSDCLRLRFRSAQVIPQFASYFFLTQEHQSWMANQCSHGATMASLNQGILERIELPLPGVQVQRRIAAILAAYDDLIENNLRRIRILEEMARALYREWFVNFRFPGNENTGSARPSWDVRPVGDVVKVLGGGTPSKKIPEFWSEGTVQWFTPTDLTAASTMYVDDSRDRITPIGLQSSSATLFPPFSVMMTSRATIGVVSINTTEACTNQGFITCIPNDRVPLHFLYFWLCENVPTFKLLASGATFKEISRGVFKRIDFSLPPVEIVSRFEKTVAPLGAEILTLQRTIKNLRRTRDLLLPRLLSGQIKLDDVDPAA